MEKIKFVDKNKLSMVGENKSTPSDIMYNLYNLVNFLIRC